MNVWLAGARLRTLPAAVVPVAVGVAVARADRFSSGGWFNYDAQNEIATGLRWWLFAAAALIVSLALQVGVNFANDYSDGIRGTDDERRVGPTRLVGSGLVQPRSVKIAAFTAFGVAGIFGAALALVVGPELFVVGALSIAAAWFYTGGKNPYGYMGLGELFVFVFFGLVATLGSAYVLIERITWLGVLAGTSVGFIACALLVINNLRDIPGDTEVGKRTLAVRLGDRRTRWFYIALMLGAWVIAGLVALRYPLVWLTWLALPLAFLPIKKVIDGAKGPDLIAVLGDTGKAQLVFGVIFAVTLWIAAPDLPIP